MRLPEENAMPASPAETDHDRRSDACPGPPAASGDAARRSVLLVEDMPMLSALLADALSDAGYDVLTATDGADAIRLLDDRAADDGVCLVVLDMYLPQVDGAGVLRHIARHGRPIPVIAMSGNIQQLGRALRTGAHEVLAKPFDLDAFLRTVMRVCGATARA
jgi:CheY-like chemotaxis protein